MTELETLLRTQWVKRDGCDHLIYDFNEVIN